MVKNTFVLSVVSFLLIFLLALFLRLSHVTQTPPGLYVDEAAIGVNASSVLLTGKDEWGIPHPLWFKSFGDYKMPLYIYATSLSMVVLGKTELAIRFPSIAAGVGTVMIVFFLVKNLITLDKDEKNKKLLGLLPFLSMFVISITPWHIHFSRGGFEVNLALFFYMLAVWLTVRFFLFKNDYLIALSVIGYVASIYTYHSFRIITPLTVVIIIGILMMKRVLFTRRIIASICLFIMLCIPVFLFSFSPEGSARFAQTSAFSEYPLKTLFEKVSLYPLVFIKNYLSFFSLDFLFSFGDGNGRHQIPNFGVLGRWQIPFIVLGLLGLFKRKRSAFSILLIILFVIAPIPAALTRPSPHSLRSLLLVIPYTLVTAYGLYMMLAVEKRAKVFVIICSTFIILFDFLFYWHFYMNHYPKVNLLDWGAGNKEIVLKTQKYSSTYDKIILDSNLSNIEIYYKFYNNGLVPQIVTPDWQRKSNEKDKKILYVRPNYAQVDKTNRIDTVYLPNVNHDIYAEFWEVK